MNDADYSTSIQLGIPCIAEPSFSPITDVSRSLLEESIGTADLVVFTSMPFEQENVDNLRIVSECCNKPILLVTDCFSKSIENCMTIADGKAFAGKKTSSYGYDHIVEYDAYTGDVLWESTVGGACSIANGSIYTIGDDGEVYAYVQTDPYVDLVVQNVSAADGNVYPYYPNEINATIKNNGNIYADNVSVSFLVNGEQKDNLVTKIGSNME